MRIGKNIVILKPGTKLFAHHIDSTRLYDFAAPIAEAVQHSVQTQVLGLRNLSGQRWMYQGPDREIKEVGPSQTCWLVSGATINFGTASGEVRL
jgi:hypothetical protein